MGVFDYLKGFLPGSNKARYQAWIMNSSPIFSSFGRNIYLSDFVNNAIERVANEISKIELRSIVQDGEILQIQNDDITRLFRFKPNPLQTTSDFFANVEWLRRKNCNAFIYPQYEILTSPNGRQFKRYLAFYPLKPSAVYIGVNNGQAWEIKLEFEDGNSFTLPYNDLIHLRWRRGANTIVGGGDDYGQKNDVDILRTIDALDKPSRDCPRE